MVEAFVGGALAGLHEEVRGDVDAGDDGTPAGEGEGEVAGTGGDVEDERSVDVRALPGPLRRTVERRVKASALPVMVLATTPKSPAIHVLRMDCLILSIGGAAVSMRVSLWAVR